MLHVVYMEAFKLNYSGTSAAASSFSTHLTAGEHLEENSNSWVTLCFKAAATIRTEAILQ